LDDSELRDAPLKHKKKREKRREKTCGNTCVLHAAEGGAVNVDVLVFFAGVCLCETYGADLRLAEDRGGYV